MPVLDAKALEIDPKGMAFLTSVLRQGSAPVALQPNEVAPPKSLPYHVRMHFRVSRRMKPLMHNLV
jgi:hypothetical protein